MVSTGARAGVRPRSRNEVATPEADCKAQARGLQARGETPSYGRKSDGRDAQHLSDHLSHAQMRQLERGFLQD
eukprot:5667324-Alexandrium_andersonii.AAC.1